MYSKILDTISSFFARFLRVFSRSPKNAHPIINFPKERENDRNLDGYTVDTLDSWDVEKITRYYCEYHQIDEIDFEMSDWEHICTTMMLSAMMTEINSYDKVADLN